MLEEYLSKITLSDNFKPYQIGANISYFKDDLPDYSSKKVAIIGIKNKNSQKPTCDSIRTQLYSLVSNTKLDQCIVDLGNIIEGETPADTNLALKEIATELRKQGLVTIVLGTDLNQAESLYQSYNAESEPIELSLISSELPVLEYELLNRICTSKPNTLVGLNAIAFQAPFVAPRAIDMFENLNFGHYRLGAIKNNIEDSELYLRNSSITIFDINAIKNCDAPGKKNSQPNGLTSEESCQLARYAGLSDTSEIFGIFEYSADNDIQNLTAKLIAQMIWYYLDGFSNRTQDSPGKHEEFIKYRCDLKENQPPIQFLKSKKTNRWWMKIENLTIPCSYSDYQSAVDGELSDRCLDSLKKLH